MLEYEKVMDNNLGFQIPDFYLQSFENYCNDVVSFLKRYKWLYDFKVTDIFIENIDAKIPDSWKTYYEHLSNEDLNNLPYETQQNDIPSSLWELISSSHKLSFNREYKNFHTSSPTEELTSNSGCGMNPKKHHEVVLLADFVASVYQESQCSLIVDVGSGLGYLGHLLCKKYSLPVIGLENKAALSHTANIRAQKQDVDSLDFQNIVFELTDKENCFSDFDLMVSQKFQESSNKSSTKNLIHDDQSNSVLQSLSDVSISCETQNDRVCMVGLHCCGDLTPAMLKLMVHSKKIRKLVCVSCCYHKMSIKDEKCDSFPMSKYLSIFLQSQNCMVNVYGLRLAAQETRARWRKQSSTDHNYHIRSVAFRGILEKYLKDNQHDVEKIRRNLSTKKDMQSFDSYVEALSKRTIHFKDNPPVVTKLKEIHDQFVDHFKYIELITVLQVLIQPVIESMIIVDRLYYLKENGLEAYSVPLFNEELSPRNLAIIVDKII